MVGASTYPTRLKEKFTPLPKRGLFFPVARRFGAVPRLGIFLGVGLDRLQHERRVTSGLLSVGFRKTVFDWQ